MRSDIQIQRDVIADIHTRLPAAARIVAVEVRGGVVRLTGQVAADAQRYALEEVVQGVEGVQGLADEIAVRRPGSIERPDTDIARAVRGVLQWQTYLPLTMVEVTVAAGWVTLKGEVESSYPRLKIADAIRLLAGVRGLHDEVLIRSAVSPAAVRAGVIAALGKRSEVDARDVKVDVQGADVTLSGSVHNWWERELARRSAWTAPGVRRVIDRLAIHY